MKTRQFGLALFITISMAACSGISEAPTMLPAVIPGVSQPAIGDPANQPAVVPIEPVTGETPTKPSADQPVSNDPGDQSAIQKPASYAPQPGDDLLIRGNVYLDRKELFMLESNPPQPVLALAGSLPDPCHVLRVLVNPPDADGNIKIEVYSLADPNKVCAQVLSGFEQSIPLSFIPGGSYTVTVNEQKVGEFVMP